MSSCQLQEGKLLSQVSLESVSSSDSLMGRNYIRNLRTIEVLICNNLIQFSKQGSIVCAFFDALTEDVKMKEEMALTFAFSKEYSIVIHN